VEKLGSGVKDGLCRIRVCLAIIIAVCILQITSQGMPKAVEIDKSNKDLDELEALLTGQHRGSSFAGDGGMYRSSLPGPNLTTVIDRPYKAAFLNDTIFGSFIGEWETGFISKTNQTYEGGIFNSPIWNLMSIEGEGGNLNQRRKPLLVSELDF
jgi:hypothetical protein